MRKICVTNKKGGVGKTTTAVNIAAGLSRRQRKVLIIDLDPQASVSQCLNVRSEISLFDVARGEAAVNACISEVATNFDAITASKDLIELENMMSQGDTLLLSRVLSRIEGYDYIILDSPPSQRVLLLNALAFASEIIIPTTTDHLGFVALNDMVKYVQELQEAGITAASISKAVPTMFDKRLKTCHLSLIAMQTEFPKLVSYPIRANSKLREAPIKKMSIFRYAPSSSGARDYEHLVEDILSLEKPAGLPSGRLPASEGV